MLAILSNLNLEESELRGGKEAAKLWLKFGEKGAREEIGGGEEFCDGRETKIWQNLNLNLNSEESELRAGWKASLTKTV